MIFLVDDIQIWEYESLAWRTVFCFMSLDRNVTSDRIVCISESVYRTLGVLLLCLDVCKYLMYVGIERRRSV